MDGPLSKILGGRGPDPPGLTPLAELLVQLTLLVIVTAMLTLP